MPARSAMIVFLATLAISGAALADVRVIEVAGTLTTRGVDLRIGDVLLASPGQPELDVWRLMVLEIEDAAHTSVSFLRERDGHRQPLVLPAGRWDLNVLPEAVAWSATSGFTTDNAVANQADAAAMWLARARQQAHARQFDSASVSFASARARAPQWGAWIDLIEAQSFEQHPDRKQPTQATERAVAALRARPESPRLLATALVVLGNARAQQRDVAGANDAAQEALQLAANTLIGAQAHALLATSAMRGGAADAAEDHLRRADAIVQQIAPDGIDAALLLARHATLSALRREGDAASSAFADALRRLQLLAPGSMMLGKISFNAHLHALERRRYAEAEAYARESMRAFASAAPDSIEYTQASAALAEVLMRRAEFAEADALFQAALATSTALDTYSYESLSLRLQLGESRLRQNQAEAALAEFDRVATLLATPAAESIRSGSNLSADVAHYRARALAELDRCEPALIAATEAQQQSAQRTATGAHSIDIDLLLSDCQRRLGRLVPAELHARQALAGFASIYADGLQMAQAHFALARVQRDSGQIDAALASYLRAIEAFEQHRVLVGGDDRIRTLWASQFQLFYKEPLQLLAELHRSGEAADLEHRYRVQSLLKLLGAGDIELSQAWSQRVSQQALSARLEDDQAMISFVVGPVHIVALLTLPGRPVAASLLPVGTASLKFDIDRLLLLGSRPMRDARSRATFDRIAAKLYNDLFGTLDTDLLRHPNWIIIADGPLLALPWAALVVGNDPATRYLAEDRVITTAASAAVWALLSEYESRSERVLAFADPAPAADISSGRAILGALPGARDEAEAVRALYRSRAEGHVGAEVRESLVRTLAADAGLVHFALHSVIDERVPMDSYIVLSPGTDALGDDGKLHAGEIASELKLNANLVVLSSCASARGGDGGGEGLLGLTSALHLAGARAVIGTRWPIADTPTAALMQDFHRALLANADSAEALAMAQRQWLQRGRDTSWTTSLARSIGWQPKMPEHAIAPFYWAGFTHSGASTGSD